MGDLHSITKAPTNLQLEDSMKDQSNIKNIFKFDTIVGMDVHDTYRCGEFEEIIFL